MAEERCAPDCALTTAVFGPWGWEGSCTCGAALRREAARQARASRPVPAGDPVLTEEEIETLRDEAVSSGEWAVRGAAFDRLAASHEALRARVAEAEARAEMAETELRDRCEHRMDGEDALRAAVAVERERCATIATDLARGPYVYEARVMAGAVGAAIRESGPSGVELAATIEAAEKEALWAAIADERDRAAAICRRLAAHGGPGNADLLDAAERIEEGP